LAEAFYVNYILGSPTGLRIWFALSTLSLNKGWSMYFLKSFGLSVKPFGSFVFIFSLLAFQVNLDFSFY